MDRFRIVYGGTLRKFLGLETGQHADFVKRGKKPDLLFTFVVQGGYTLMKKIVFMAVLLPLLSLAAGAYGQNAVLIIEDVQLGASTVSSVDVPVVFSNIDAGPSRGFQALVEFDTTAFSVDTVLIASSRLTDLSFDALFNVQDNGRLNILVFSAISSDLIAVGVDTAVTIRFEVLAGAAFPENVDFVGDGTFVSDASGIKTSVILDNGVIFAAPASLSIPDVQLTSGDTAVGVPVVFDNINAGPSRGFQAFVKYDTTKLSVATVTVISNRLSDAGFDVQFNVQSDGILNILVFSPEADSLIATGSDTAVNVSFDIVSGAAFPDSVKFADGTVVSDANERSIPVILDNGAILPPGVLLTIPDVTLATRTATTVDVPIEFDNTDGDSSRGMELVLEFDTAKLSVGTVTIVSERLTPLSFIVDFQTQADGRLKILLFSPISAEVISVGSDTLLNVKFDILSGATFPDSVKFADGTTVSGSTGLAVPVVTDNGAILPAVLIPASLTIPDVQLVSGDTIVDVPIVFDNIAAGPSRGFQAFVQYDTTKLSVDSMTVVSSRLTDALFDAQFNVQADGVLNIVVFSPEADSLIAAGSDTALTISFAIRAGAVFPDSVKFADGTIVSDADGLSIPVILDNGAILPPVPTVAVSPAAIDFDSVTVGTTKKDTLIVISTGTGTLQLDSLVLSGNSVFSAPSGPFAIAPGESLEVEVTFTPDTTRVFSDTLTLFSNATNDPSVKVPLAGTGSGFPAIDAAPDTLNFGNVAVNSSKRDTVVVKSVGSILPLEIDSIAVTSGDAVFSIAGIVDIGDSSIAVGDSFKVAVAYSPTETGLDAGALTIFSNSVSDPNLEVRLTGTGVAPDINVSPLAIDFGSVEVGSTSDSLVVISNLGDADLTLGTLIVADSVNYSFSPDLSGAIIPPSGSDTLVVTFKPQSIGAFPAVLAIPSDDPDALEDTVLVNLTGVGLAPDIDVSPVAIDFDTVVVGGLKKDTLIIANTGNDTLVLGTLSKIGANPLAFTFAPILANVSGSAVAPGESISVVANFSPGAPGPKSATLVIPSNDPDAVEDTIFVSLTGFALGFARVAVDRDTVDFGDVVKIDTTRVETVFVKNVGVSINLALDPDNLTIDNPVFRVVSISKSSVAPGDSAAVAVRVGPGAAAGPVSGVLTISSNADNSPNLVTLEANLLGFAAVETIPDTVDFGNIVILFTPRTDTVVVKNAGMDLVLIIDSLVVTRADSVYSIVEVIGDSSIAEVDDSLMVVVKYSPKGLGPDEGTLTIFSNAFGTPAEEVTLLGSAGGFADIDVDPDTLNFGNVRFGQSKIDSVQIISAGVDTSLTIDSVAVSGDPDFLLVAPVTGAVLSDGSSLFAVVQYTPDDVGADSGVLTVFSNAIADSVLGVPLKGRGIAPDIDVSPDSIDYGGVAVGESADDTVTIRNLGDADLLLGTLSLTGVDTSEFSILAPDPSDSTVAPGDSTEAVVRFSPSSAGAKFATLVIPSDDPDEATVSVSLTGVGLVPDIDVSPDSIGFGGVAVSQNADDTVTIRNLGDADLLLETLSLTGVDTSEFSILAPDPSDSTVAPGDSTEAVVRFSPSSAGAKFATLVIPSDDSDEATVSVSLTGVGLVSIKEVSRDSIDFGDVPKDSLKVDSVFVRNVGDAPAKIISVKTGTLAFTVFTPSFGDSLISPSDSLRIDVAFSPDTTGVFEDTLIVINGLPSAPDTLKVPLVGRGVLINVLDVGNAQAYAGDVGVEVPLTILNNDTLSGVQFDLVFDASSLTLVDVKPRFGLPTSFTPPDVVAGTNTATVAILDIPPSTNTIPINADLDTLAILVFDVKPGIPAGIVPLDLADVKFVGAEGDTLQPDAVALDGSIQILFGTNIDVAPDTLIFAGSPPNDTSLAALRVFNVGNRDSLIVNQIISSNPSVFSVVDPLPSGPIAKVDSLDITFRFTPPDTGLFIATATIVSNDANGDTVIVRLEGQGRIPNVVDISAGGSGFAGDRRRPVALVVAADDTIIGLQFELAFNTNSLSLVDITSNVPATFTPDSVLSAGVDTVTIVLLDTDAENPPLLVIPGIRDTVATLFFDVAPGTPAGLLALVILENNVQFSDLDGNPLSPSIGIAGEFEVLAGPNIVVSPVPIDLDTVSTNESKDTLLVITNVGNLALNLDTLTLAGNSARDTVFAIDLSGIALPDAPLAVGESDTVVVTFTPVDTVSYAAVITVVSNDPDADSVFVDLTGIGEIAGFNISGSVKYFSDLAKSVPDVVISLDEQPGGTFVDADTTLTDGTYELLLVPAGVDYRATPLKTDLPGSDPVSINDAVFVLQKLGGLKVFDVATSLSADTDGDAVVSINDAVFILQKLGGLKTLPFAPGLWGFVPANIDYLALSADQSGQDYIGVIVGDVDGDFKNQLPPAAKSIEPQPSSIRLSLDDFERGSGKTWTVRLAINRPDSIFGVDVGIEYPVGVIDVQEVRKIKDNSNRLFVSNLENEGQIDIAMASAMPIEGDGSLFEIEFEIIGEPNEPGFTLTRGMISDAIRVIDLRPANERFAILPKEASLSQNYPNPFNPETTIEYAVPTGSGAVPVKLSIYNAIGQQMKILVDEKVNPGFYSVVWDGRDNQGRLVGTGVYFYRIVAGKFATTKKMVFLK